MVGDSMFNVRLGVPESGQSGWYEDPQDPRYVREWDGERWGDIAYDKRFRMRWKPICLAWWVVFWTLWFAVVANYHNEGSRSLWFGAVAGELIAAWFLNFQVARRLRVSFWWAFGRSLKYSIVLFW